MTGTPSGRQLHMDSGTKRCFFMVGPFLHEPNYDAERMCGKEAGSKALVRGTRNVYEAAKVGRGRVGVQSPKSHPELRSYMRRICGAKVTRLTPGDLSICLENWSETRLRNSRKRSPGRSRGTTRQRSEPRAKRNQVQTREAARLTKDRQKSAESISCRRTATKEEHRELNRNGAIDE